MPRRSRAVLTPPALLLAALLSSCGADGGGDRGGAAVPAPVPSPTPVETFSPTPAPADDPVLLAQQAAKDLVETTATIGIESGSGLDASEEQIAALTEASKGRLEMSKDADVVTVVHDPTGCVFEFAPYDARVECAGEQISALMAFDYPGAKRGPHGH